MCSLSNQIAPIAAILRQHPLHDRAAFKYLAKRPVGPRRDWFQDFTCGAFRTLLPDFV